MPITINRNAIPVLAIVAAAGLTMTACEDRSETSAMDEQTSTMNEQMNNAADATQDAAEGAQRMAADAKDTFIETANNQLARLEAQIDEFISNARENMPDAGSEINRVRDELNNAIANAKVELEQVRNAGADGWEDASARFKDILSEVQRSFNQVKEQFSNAVPNFNAPGR